MFKLTKIYNSGVNVAEPCRMYTTAGTAYRIGSALTVTAGKLTNATETAKPEYIAAESAAAGEKKTLLCYPVFDNMVFEAPVSGTPTSIKVGTKIVLALTEGFADRLGVSTTDGVATVVDTRGATRAGDKIFVKFQ